ncbi:MAG: primase C-terminal domain-containing protein [Candidatus Bathyarchaeia archaeon]
MDLKGAARQYWLLGCNIVLLRGKEPLHKWSQWRSERQSELNFEALPWNEADGFAIICGQQMHNELYVGAVDFDVKNLPQETVDKGKQVLKFMPITQMEETPSRGQHWIYFTRKKPKSVSAFHNVAALELVGENKLLIMAPSKGYRRLNDNTATIVENLENLFLEALAKAGVKIARITSEFWFDKPDLAKQPYRGKAPPCIRSLMEGTKQGLRNEYAVRLAGFLCNFKKLEPKKAWKQLQEWNQRNQPPLPETELSACFKSAVEKRYVYGCSDNILASLCDMENCSLAKTEVKEQESAKKQLKDSGVLPDGCFEAIYHNGKPCFLILNSRKFFIAEKVEVEGKCFLPKEARNVPYEPYGFYEGEVDVHSLFEDVKLWIQKLIDVEPIYRDILAVCVLMSYQQEKLHTVPYLFFFGDNESGKSTVLKVLNKLCYRPLFGVTIPAADLYGYLEDSDSIGCILEDEVQGIHKDTDKIKIYKSGYSRGAKVPRMITTEYSRYIKYYNVFCFKACASEQIPQVKGFNERFLFVAMVEGYPQLEWVDLTKEQMEQLNALRNKLLKWRMLTRNQELPEIQLKIKGRLKELWKPLLQVAYGLPAYENLVNFLEEQQKERLSGKQDTLEGKIVKVVVDLFNSNLEGLPTIPFSTIWSNLQEELNAKIDSQKDYVMHTSEFDDVTKNKVGYRLREILSGKTQVKKEKDLEGNWVSIKAYVFDVNKLKRIARKYGYEFSTKLPSVPSSESVSTSETMEKVHENNVEKEAPTPLQLGTLSNSVESQLQEQKPQDLLQCHFCRSIGKSKFFATQADLDRHLVALHSGYQGKREVKG